MVKKYIMHECDSEHRIKPEHKRKYKSLCKQMQCLLDEIRKYESGANLYVEDNSNWYLMIGPTHDDNSPNCDPLQENAALLCTVWPSGGGGW